MNPYGFTSHPNNTPNKKDQFATNTSGTGNSATSNGTHAHNGTGSTGSSFAFSSFGQPTSTTIGLTGQSTTTTTTNTTAKSDLPPTKRGSIDESWVTVDWNDLNRRSNPQSPPKSPRIEHPMASVLAPPSDLEGRARPETQPLQSKTSTFGFGGFGIEVKPSMTTTTAPATTKSTLPSTPASTSIMNGSSITSNGMGTTAHQSSTGSYMPSFGYPKSPVRDEPPKSPQMAPKSPVPKPATPAREPIPVSVPPTISSVPKNSTGSTIKHHPQGHEIEAPAKPLSAPKVETPVTTTTGRKSEPEIKPVTPKVQQGAEENNHEERGKGKEAKLSQEEAPASKSRTPRKSPSTPATPRSSGRTRKAVDRLSPGIMEGVHEVKTIEIPQGSGTKLGDISHVAKELSKRKADYPPIITVHRLLFGRPGEHTKRKANLRQFNGFATTEEVGKVTEKLSHHTVDELRMICGFLNLEWGGEKKTLAERIANYLNKPRDLGESKPTPKRAATPQKQSRSTTPKKKAKSSKAATPRKSSKSKSSEEEDYDETMEGGEQAEQDMATDN